MSQDIYIPGDDEGEGEESTDEPQIGDVDDIEAMPDEPAELAPSTDGPLPFTEPMPKVFPARQGSTTSQWRELAVKSGALVDYTDGRSCTSDADPSAVIELADDQFALIETVDPTGGGTAYVKVAGGAAPTPAPSAISSAQIVEAVHDDEAVDPVDH